VFALFLNACADRRPPVGGSARFFEVTRQLTEAAPDLSVAYSMHAVAAAVMSQTSPASTAHPFFVAARAAADRALKLDPHNGEAYFAMGVSYALGADWLERERYFTRAAELSPDLSVVNNYQVGVLGEVGRTLEATELNAAIAGRDTYSPYVLRNLALARAMMGDQPGAETLLDKIQLMAPEVARAARLTIALWWTDPADAPAKIEQFGRGQAKDADLACFSAYLKQLPQQGAEPRRGLPSLCADQPLEVRLRMLAREGDVDGAYGAAPHAPGTLNDTAMFFQPEMQAFRRDRRFIALARDLGLVEYWQKTGRWPDFCAEPDRAYDCREEAARLPPLRPGV
jgi:tetratricopeptide (TPR) repeat protein